MKSNLIHSIILSTLALAGVITSAFANPPKPDDEILEPDGRQMLVGVFGGIDYNMHRGEFYTTVNGITCCRFDNGSGIGAVGGARSFIPVTDRLSISPRLLYENRGGRFLSDEETYPIFGENNRVEMVHFRNQLDVSLHTLTVDALASYTLTSFGLYVTAGPSASIAFSKRFSKSESIVSPDRVKYLNGATSRQLFSGDMDFVNTALFSLRGGIGAAFPVTGNIYLNPEALYSFPLNRVSQQDNWKASSIQGSLGVLVAF
jgi:hypothetical protein